MPERSPEEIKQALLDWGLILKARRDRALGGCTQAEGQDIIPPNELGFATPEEKEKIYHLKLALPSQGQEAAWARERNKRRRAEKLNRRIP